MTKHEYYTLNKISPMTTLTGRDKPSISNYILDFRRQKLGILRGNKVLFQQVMRICLRSNKLGLSLPLQLWPRDVFGP